MQAREEDRRFAETLGRWVLGALDLLGGYLLALAGSSDEEDAGAGHLPPGGQPAAPRCACYACSNLESLQE